MSGAETSLALVLLSGGMDSAAALWWAVERHRVVTLAFEPPGTPAAEREASRALARAARVTDHREIPLPWLRGGDDGRHPPGYLPRRNLVYYAVAGSIAEQLGAAAIVGGHLATDGIDFPDARTAYFRDLEALVGIPIVLPFIDMTKPEVVRWGRERGVPFELSWSCYRDLPRPCGECVSCRERAEALVSQGDLS